MKHAKRPSSLHFSDQLERRLNETAAPSAGQTAKSASRHGSEAGPRIAAAVRWHHPVKCVLTVLVAVVFTATAWAYPLRPTYSDVEQRELAKFPTFSIDTLLSGDYFDDISTWFSDTFPGREQWVSASASIRRLFGIQSSSLHGTIDQPDEIPTDVTSATTTTAPSPTETTASAPTTTTTPAPTTTTTASGPSWDHDQNLAGQSESLGAVLVMGDTAYEYYSFLRQEADTYVATVNRAATALKGQATVYDMIVPTSIDVMLPDKTKATLNSSDQGAAIQYLAASLDPLAQSVNVRDTLLAHNDEYIYFHTDHHWTALGAYYAYCEFMTAQGITPHALADYEVKSFDGFLGSFYSDTQNAGLKLNADTVYAYEPLSSLSMTYRDTSGNSVSWSVITDVSSWSSRYKYNTFIGGDNPLTVINNQDLQDGSSIVVVKESYGNAFVPFLTDHYQTVYVIDYRYYSGSLTSFVKEHNVPTVLFLNNISATRSSKLTSELSGLVP